ncbi:MAG: SEC-C metal-binding domain-containing protein, partial [Thermacetogeniaceae bacterium]
MRIFNLERNSICPCGSGRKYKKCCQSRVDEAAHRISQAVGTGGFTAEGLEVIETLAVLCGLQAEEGHPPAPEKVGRLLHEAWEEEERLRNSFDEGALTALSMRVQVLLGEKHQLRTIRIPVWRFGLRGMEEQNGSIVDEILE